MKQMLRYVLILGLLAPLGAHAQFEKMKDSVVQLYGVIMTADSLRGIPSVSVAVYGRRQGTFSNDQGVFSIAVMKGDRIEFTSIGYKPKMIEIPRNIEGNSYSIIQLMVQDTQYLPVTIIKPRPTKEQFERDFVNLDFPDDDYEIARQNTSESKRRALVRTLPRDAQEMVNYNLRQGAQRYYSAGQVPPMNILNPAAWGEFIQAWKRGDFKNPD
ncbi:MAG: carboxypeptidase-like regulatory domain-containing protein [Chitinophagaceae bacterium]|nr:carboxypeptidase-like regulatory domain-containing protein [Chitinophagaceae bacterium]